MKWAGSAIAVCTLLLMALGLVTLASVGDVQSLRHFHDPNRFLLQQAAFDSLAACLAVGAILVPPSAWFRPRVLAALGALVALGLASTHVPGLRYEALGAARWIRVAGFSLQPSEFVKIAAIILVSAWIGRRGPRLRRFATGFLPPVAGIGLVLLGFFLQDDLGSCVMLAGVNATLLFMGGARVRHLALFAVVAAALGGAWIMHSPVRRARLFPKALPAAVEAAADPAGMTAEQAEAAKREAAAKRAKASDRNYQVRMAASAFAAGGLTGRGLGNSLYKRHYLPENHTDFILAMVGEELGFVATGTCVALFAIMLACGLFVAWNAPDAERRWMAAGLTLHICLSAAVNVGVVTGLTPTKGLALPFLSYGGSSVLASALAAGLLLAIAFRPGRQRPASPQAARRRERENLEFWTE